MSEQNERRCLGCHKRLIDETVPYCYRCRLETLEAAGTVAKGGAILLGMVGAAGVATIAKAVLGGDSTDGDGGES